MTVRSIARPKVRGDSHRRASLPQLPIPTPLRTLPEQIADGLRQAILQGRLRSGAHLVETRIAEQMRTSRGPVRDALLLLERDGLAVKLPNRGTRVPDFNERALREAATLRAALEEFAIGLLVPRLTAEAIARLETLLLRMETAARRRAPKDFNEADFQFHDAILQTCGHRTLHEVWRGMQRRIRAFLASSNRVSGDLGTVAERHRAILRGLASRRLASARQALRAHFARLQEELDLLLAAQTERAGDGPRRSAIRSSGPLPKRSAPERKPS